MKIGLERLSQVLLQIFVVYYNYYIITRVSSYIKYFLWKKLSVFYFVKTFEVKSKRVEDLNPS